MTDPNLITSYTFQGRPFLVKMNVINGCLELIFTDKQSGEEWECSYDSSYIENLTRKTGNYKQFEIFTAMLKSGLLKTSESIALDLLTYEDLEGMRIRRSRNYSSTRLLGNNNNRRYLIVTYSVEFDRINYPLPLEYCGPPDPVILQATIRRLETELQTAYEELNLKNNSNEKHKVKILQKRVDDLTTENMQLTEEVKQLTRIISKNPNGHQVQTFQKAITQIERNLVSERNSHHKLLEKLQNEKSYLLTQVEKLKGSEKSLKVKLQQALSRYPSSTNRENYKSKQLSGSKSCEPTVHTIYERRKSPSVRKINKCAQTQRSRSVSPRIVFDDYDNYFEHSHRNKSRSRSSSASAKKSQGQVSEYIGISPISPDLTPIPSPRHSRKPSPQSGRSSVKSYGSEGQRSKFKKQNSPSRSAPPNLVQLQRRVNRMFQSQRTNKKYIK